MPRLEMTLEMSFITTIFVVVVTSDSLSVIRMKGLNSLKNNLTALRGGYQSCDTFPLIQPGMTYEHRHCGGRRSAPVLMRLTPRSYHGITKSPYPLPNDDAEKSRLDKLQHCVRARLGANVIAPITPCPTHISISAARQMRALLIVVDVGTGSGRWVFEVAEEFPNAKVTGIDLSPICSDELSPKNVEFRVMDLTQGLHFPSSSTDLVHSRLAYCFSLMYIDWCTVASQNLNGHPI
jgi:hypothetical protein